ncbi:MAG: hypothetical protein HC941_27435 [Microcoleus sp. SU_5_3]|nr:hypothetical protein [Microcoleus sp. SU_5_3]
MFQWIKDLFGRGSAVTVVIWIPHTDREQYRQITNSLYEWRQQWKQQIQLSFTTNVYDRYYEPESNCKRNGKLKVAVVITSDSAILKSLPVGVKSRTIPSLSPVWSVTATVKNQTYLIKGIEIQGSKHFEPGAKVYPCQQWSGDGYERPYVVGLHRETQKFTSVVCASDRFENWKVELVENPILIFQFQQTTGGWWSDDPKQKEEAQLLADGMNARNARIKSMKNE